MQEETEILAPETFVTLPVSPVGPLWPFAPATSGVVSCPTDVPCPTRVHRAPPPQAKYFPAVRAAAFFCLGSFFLTGCYSAKALHRAYAKGVLHGADYRPDRIMMDMIYLKNELDQINHKIVELSDAADQAKKKYDDLRTFKFDFPILPAHLTTLPSSIQTLEGHIQDLHTLGGTAKDVQP